MTLPDFLVVGTAKSGTSTLAGYLRSHKDVFMAPYEINFFGNDRAFALGLDWYQRHFRDATTEKRIGEKTPAYSYIPGVAKRIYDCLGPTKLIWVFRNPIDRTYSNYWHAVVRGIEPRSFEKAVLADINGKERNRVRMYVRRSKYAEQVERFTAYQSKKEMHFMLFESLRTKTEQELASVCEFLRIPMDRSMLEVPRHENKSYIPRSVALHYVVRKALGKRLFSRIRHRNLRANAGYPDMLPSTRARLREYFQKPNEELSRLIDMDLSVWD